MYYISQSSSTCLHDLIIISCYEILSCKKIKNQFVSLVCAFYIFPSKAHKFFSTTPAFCTKEEDQVSCTNTNVSPDQKQKTQVQTKKNLLQLIHGMKIELSTKKKVMENVQSRLLEDDEKR